MQHSFNALGVSAAVEQALAALDIVEPFRIQSLVLPDALAGRDVLAKAPTGARVSCRNTRWTTIGRVPAPGQPPHGWAANGSGYAPGLLLTRRSDGSLVVHCR